MMAGMIRKSLVFSSSLCCKFQTKNKWFSSLPPFESNIVRLLSDEIHHFPPHHQRDKEFNAFMVEDRPGEQLVTLTRSMYNETIKIEATMFDGYGVISPNSRDEDTDNEQLHISVLVDITKGEGGDMLEFVCSAWQERLEIQKLYVFGLNGRSPRPYTGPDFRVVDKKLQSSFYDYLNARGINDDLSIFLHRYVWNKDKLEHMQCLKRLKSYVER